MGRGCDPGDGAVEGAVCCKETAPCSIAAFEIKILFPLPVLKPPNPPPPPAEKEEATETKALMIPPNIPPPPVEKEEAAEEDEDEEDEEDEEDDEDDEEASL